MLLKNPLNFINGRSMTRGYPEGYEQLTIGMGCFWGAERLYWKIPGVYVTSVGYGGGHGENPNYESICSGVSGHAELVHIVFDPNIVSFDALLKIFFENHDPTQGNRQGNDRGSQYRSVLFTRGKSQAAKAAAARALYNDAYTKAAAPEITTQIMPAETYHFAEDYHQQYLAKNPGGYCAIGPTGVVCPVPE
ncbi:MAG: peptide-methionine (S)-S-oxide reductase MsrA [Robiginitomaculum sp.]